VANLVHGRRQLTHAGANMFLDALNELSPGIFQTFYVLLDNIIILLITNRDLQKPVLLVHIPLCFLIYFQFVIMNCKLNKIMCVSFPSV
jgi:hypothetical protein